VAANVPIAISAEMVARASLAEPSSDLARSLHRCEMNSLLTRASLCWRIARRRDAHRPASALTVPAPTHSIQATGTACPQHWAKRSAGVPILRRLLGATPRR
jgi:hypothetical protein